MVQKPEIPLEICRLLKALGADRRRLAVRAQRQRLIRSIVVNDERQKGLR